MKKLKMDLNGIGELLSKEQMKMVTGGDYFNNYIQCNWQADEWSYNGYQNYVGRSNIVNGAYPPQYQENVSDCYYFCYNYLKPGGYEYSYQYYTNAELTWCGGY